MGRRLVAPANYTNDRGEFVSEEGAAVARKAPHQSARKRESKGSGPTARRVVKHPPADARHDPPAVSESAVAASAVAESVVAESPLAAPPVAESPVAAPPAAESPVAESPVAESPVAESPVAESAASVRELKDPAPSPPLVAPGAFAFEVHLEVSGPIGVFADAAVIRARFRHFNHEPIDLKPGVDSALNLGLRLYPRGGHIQLFETRFAVDERPIEPDVWTIGAARIPSNLVNFADEFVLVVDFVKEKEFWFASKGAPEYSATVSFVDAAAERVEQSASTQSALDRASTALAAQGVSGSADSNTSGEPGKLAKLNLVFDVSDLVQYFQNARLPTGIQRVQIEVITSLGFSSPENCSIKIGCFTKQSDTWIEVPILFFNHICKLAVVNGDPNAPDWLRVLEELRMHLQQAKRLVFSPGAYLINLGTSWWLQNYFLHVRAAKARYGIRYVPFVHDCIPIMTPEHCVEGLTRDFITWALGAFQHADHIMVNSKATAADVKAVAKRLGHPIDSPVVISLDADYRAANAKLPPELGAFANSEIFQRNDIRAGQYVLFVSTIESRKNHTMAFSAWLALCKRYGPKRVPKLVCVGNRGWLNDAIYAKLSASAILRQKITMLSKISDPDLELLYRNCLFTIYPSSYEGWGLPVTESLCFGKVPVLANGSSLPEAGGEFGEYFDLGSESSLLQILERMIFDAEYRTAKEHHIETFFRPRAWADIATSILRQVREWAAVDKPLTPGQSLFSARGVWPFGAQLGRYYGLTENEHTHIWRGMVAGEMFRQGDGWWWTEPWGCWTKTKGARLAFVAPLPAESAAVLFVCIRGIQGSECTAKVNLEGVGRRTAQLQPEQSRWLIFSVSREALAALPRSEEGVLFELHFICDKYADFSQSTKGVDHRTASVGVCGFMVCAADDIETRLRFMESVALSDMQNLLATPEADAFGSDIE